MAVIKTLAEYSEEISHCVKCGVCQAHCPVYRHTRKEGDVARGKLTLAAMLVENKVELANRLEDDMSMCLMCGSCMEKCPYKVPTHEIVGAIRREISREKGLSSTGKLVSSLLGSPLLMKTMAKTGAVFSSAVLKKVPESSGLRLRYPVSFMENRTLPQVHFKNFFQRVPEYIAGDSDKETVCFFAGCAITHLYPEIGEAMIKILKYLGYPVYIPRSQGCCGIPALSAGAGRLVEKLAEKNVKAFEKYKGATVITACASCRGGIQDYYATMHGIDRGFCENVMDFSVFLQQTGFTDKLKELKKKAGAESPARKITYHDPCHLKTHGIKEEPRELLRSLPGVEFVEMENASLCCGLGGTFSVHHYDVSKNIGSVKADGIRNSGAERVATSCPGCIIQLQDSINHADLQVKAVHVLELIAEALSLS